MAQEQFDLLTGAEKGQLLTTGVLLFAKRDLKMVNDAAREVGVDRDLFGEYLHDLKDDVNMKANQNFTYKELLKYARELKNRIKGD